MHESSDILPKPRRFTFISHAVGQKINRYYWNGGIAELII